MANQAVVGILRTLLTADTAQYETGMKKAAQTATQTGKVIGAIGPQIAKTTPQMERMVKAFQGDKLLYQANNLVAAVTKVGGAVRLTETESQKVNRTLTQAIDKYRALGQQAPAAMLRLEQATRRTEQATTGLGQATSGLGLGLTNVGKSILTTAAGFITAQAAIAAFRSVVRSVVDELTSLITQGPAIADVAENFTHLTAEAGRTGRTLLGALRVGTHNTISDFELMKIATQDLAAGLRLTDEQFGTLAKGAFALAQATGGDVKTALDTMNDAMLTGRTRSLALLTGKIDLEKAEIAFAQSLGVTRDRLSEEGKLEAARVAILESVGNAINRLGEQTDGLDEKIAQARTGWANFHDQLAATVGTSPTLIAAFDSISSALTAAFGPDKAQLVKVVASLIDDAAIAVAQFAKTVVTSAGFIVKEFIAINKLLGNTAQIADGVRLAFLYLQQSATLATGDIASWKKLDDQIGRLMLTMKQRGQALQEEDRAQKSVDTTAAGYVKTLDKVIAAMEGARARTRETSSALTQQESEVRKNTGALVDYNAFLDQTTDSTKKLTFAQQQQLEQWRNLSAIANQAGMAQQAAGAAAEQAAQDAFESATEIQRLSLETELQAKDRAAQLFLQAELEDHERRVREAKDFQGTLRDINNKAGEEQMEGQRRLMEEQTAAARELGKSIRDQLTQAFTGDLGTLFFGQFAHDPMGELKAAAQEAELEYLRLSRSGRASAKEIQTAFERFREAEDRANFTFGERFKSLWAGIKTSIINVLNEILDFFIKQFVVGLIKGFSQARLGQAWSNFITGATGGMAGGGGIGGTAAKVAGSAIPGGVLTGATATGLTAGSAAGGTLASYGASSGVLAAGTGVGAGAGTGTAAAAGGGGGAGFLANPAFWTNPWTIGVVGGIALTYAIWKKGLFRGGEEALKVNPRRDKFFSQFGDPSNKGVGGAGHNLAMTFTRLTGIPSGGPLFRNLQIADTVKEWEAAQSAAIAGLTKGGIRGIKSFAMGGFVPPNVNQFAVLHGGRFGEDITPRLGPGVAGGTVVNNYSYRTVNNHIAGVLDRGSVKDVMRDHVYPELNREMLLDQHGFRSSVKKVGIP